MGVTISKASRRENTSIGVFPAVRTGMVGETNAATRMEVEPASLYRDLKEEAYALLLASPIHPWKDRRTLYRMPPSANGDSKVT